MIKTVVKKCINQINGEIFTRVTNVEILRSPKRIKSSKSVNDFVVDIGGFTNDDGGTDYVIKPG